MSDVGISAFAVYVPWLRMPHGVWARAWAAKAREGGRAVANFDEDALTMAVAAAEGMAEGARGLFFASVSAPFVEGSVAARVAAAVGRRGVWAVDFGGSTRAALDAVVAAAAAALAGRGPVIVVSADTRVAEPGSRPEALWNDGAVAARVESGAAVAVRILGAASVSDPVPARWRADGARFVTVDESRAGSDAERRAARDAGDAAQKQAGLAGEPLVDWADFPAWLAKSPRGARAATVATGDGATAIAVEVVRDRPVALATRATRDLVDYNDYARRRGLAGPVVSPVLERNETAALIELEGGRCGGCGQVQYPQSIVCVRCHANATQAPHRLAREGAIYTYTVDALFEGWGPETAMAVVDLDDGARVYVQVTDCDTSDVRVGMRVRLTYRRLHEADQKPLYYWKAMPA